MSRLQNERTDSFRQTAHFMRMVADGGAFAASSLGVIKYGTWFVMAGAWSLFPGVFILSALFITAGLMLSSLQNYKTADLLQEAYAHPKLDGVPMNKAIGKAAWLGLSRSMAGRLVVVPVRLALRAVKICMRTVDGRVPEQVEEFEPLFLPKPVRTRLQIKTPEQTVAESGLTRIRLPAGNIKQTIVPHP